MKNKTMKIIVMITILLVMMGIFATNIVNAAVQLPPISTNTTEDPTGNVQPANTQTPVTPVSPVTPTTPTNNTSNYTNNTNLPQTGDASDYAIFAIIIVALIGAIYAFKRIRDYNNI